VTESEKFKVLWVYQSIKHNGVKHEAGQIPSLCFCGRKKMVCVSAGHPVRVIVRDAKDFRLLREVDRGSAPYQVAEAAVKFQQMGLRNGITAGAARILERALAPDPGAELDEGQFENEEEIAVETTKKDVKESTDAAVAGAAAEGSGTKQEKTVAKKTKKAKAPKAEKKVKAAKPAKAPKVAKAPREKGDGLGREGIGRDINEMLVKGKGNATIAEAMAKKYPDAKNVDAARISWYRWSAAKKGLIKAEKKEAKK
jgi:hypothetical protein